MTKPVTELTGEHIDEAYSFVMGHIEYNEYACGEKLQLLSDLALEALAHREPAGDAGEMCERLKRGVVTIGRWPPQGPDIEATEAVMEEAADLIQQQAARIEELEPIVSCAQEWCDAVDCGTSWDDWDYHFKKMKYELLPTLPTEKGTPQ